MSDPRNQLSADCEQTTSLLRTLTDLRFTRIDGRPDKAGSAAADTAGAPVTHG